MSTIKNLTNILEYHIANKIIMRFINTTAYSGFTFYERVNGKRVYSFYIGDDCFKSETKDILEKDFEIVGKTLNEIHHNDNKYLILTKIDENFGGESMEVIESKNVSPFGKPFPVPYFCAAGEKGYSYKTYMLFLRNGDKGEITFKLESSFLFGLLKSESELIHLKFF